MRSIILAVASVAGMAAAPAFAADLPVRQAPPAPVVYAPLFTWTGVYVGLNAGIGWSNSGNVTVGGPLVGATNLIDVGSSSGFVGGGQIGYNAQFGQFVAGVEADIQYADLGGGVTWGPYSYLGISRGSNGQYFGTVRARLGYAMDRILIYATGGLAYGGLNSTAWHGTTSDAGWTLGGGVEYAFTNNWTAKVEGLYVNLDSGNKSLTVFDPVFGVSRTLYAKSGNGGGLFRVGVNYKF